MRLCQAYLTGAYSFKHAIVSRASLGKLANRAMDWTGGIRKRYANRSGADATLQKQKAYFAKQRVKTQTPLMQSPPHDKQSIEFGRLQPPHEARAQLYRDSEQPPPAPSRRFPRIHRPNACDNSHILGENLRQAITQPSPQASDFLLRPSTRTRVKCRTSSQKSNRASACGSIQAEEHGVFREQRRQLLERHDWLGLAVLKPVKFEFPRDRDKGQVGKRRRLTKSLGHKQIAAVHPHLGPTFDHYEKSKRRIMSESVLTDEVVVRIGTQAFTSQTLPRGRSPPSANTSMDPLSLSLGPISEESMLLGDDEDMLETQHGQTYKAEHGSFGNREPHRQALDQISNELYPSRRRCSDVDDVGDHVAVSERICESTSERETTNESSAGRPSAVKSDAGSQCWTLEQFPSPPVNNHSLNDYSSSSDVYFDRRSSEHPVESTPPASEYVSRKISKDPRPADSRSEKRFSPFLARPSRSHNPSTTNIPGPPFDAEPSRNLHLGPSHNKSTNLSRPDQEVRPVSLTATKGHHTPSIAKRFNDHASRDTEDDLAWREFIVGSKRSTSISSPPRTPRLVHRGTSCLTSLVPDLASQLDGPRSDRATIGDTQYASPRRFSDGRVSRAVHVSSSVSEHRGHASLDVRVGSMDDRGSVRSSYWTSSY